jgi:hypothetical protein
MQATAACHGILTQAYAARRCNSEAQGCPTHHSTGGAGFPSIPQGAISQARAAAAGTSNHKRPPPRGPWTGTANAAAQGHGVSQSSKPVGAGQSRSERGGQVSREKHRTHSAAALGEKWQCLEVQAYHPPRPGSSISSYGGGLHPEEAEEYDQFREWSREPTAPNPSKATGSQSRRLRK